MQKVIGRGLLTVHRCQSRHIASRLRSVAIIGLALAFAQPLQAEMFKCAAGDVQCLIAAINQTNANGHPQNTIHLETGTYTLTHIDNDTDGPNGLPSITSNLKIDVAANKTATI